MDGVQDGGGDGGNGGGVGVAGGLQGPIDDMGALGRFKRRNQRPIIKLVWWHVLGVGGAGDDLHTRCLLLLVQDNYVPSIQGTICGR